MFSRIIVFLLLALLILSCDKKTISLPSRTVRINILGKFRLKAVVVEDICGRIFAGDHMVSVSGGRLKISVFGKGIRVTHENRNYVVQYLGLSTWSPFRIVISNGRNSRYYTGNLDVRENAGTLEVVALVPVESYIAAAARAELGVTLKNNKEGTGDSFRGELISAMEIAIRSYILSQENRHEGQNYQFCDLTHCVHFPGTGKVQSESITAGSVLITENGRIVTAYFHSTCGGILSGPEVYWRGHKKGGTFRSGNDRWHIDSGQACAQSPHYRWHAVISKHDIEKICDLKKITYIQPHRIGQRISVLKIGHQGERIASVPISRFLSGAGRILGWNVIRSNYFIIRRQGKHYILDGHGLGHGTGLCQWGARGHAIQGATCKEILEFYYPGAEIVQGTYK